MIVDKYKLGNNTLSGNLAVLPGEKVFTTSGIFIVPTGVTSVEVLVVAGGGGGGCGESNSGGSGGGGAGGLVYVSAESVVSLSEISVVVGAGGAGVSSKANGNNGGNSSFGSITALGGGGGGNYSNGEGVCTLRYPGQYGNTRPNRDAVSRTVQQ